MWAINSTLHSIASFLFYFTQHLGVVFPVRESGYNRLQMNMKSDKWGGCTFLFFLIINLVKFTCVEMNFSAVKESEKENFMGYSNGISHLECTSSDIFFLEIINVRIIFYFPLTIVIGGLLSLSYYCLSPVLTILNINEKYY